MKIQSLSRFLFPIKNATNLLYKNAFFTHFPKPNSSSNGSFNTMLLSTKFNFSIKSEDTIREAELDEIFSREGMSNKYFEKFSSYTNAIHNEQGRVKACKNQTKRVLAKYGEDSQLYLMSLVFPYELMGCQTITPESLESLLKIEQLKKKNSGKEYFNNFFTSRNIQFFIGINLLAVGQLGPAMKRFNEYLENPKRITHHKREVVHYQFRTRQMMYNLSFELKEPINEVEYFEKMSKLLKQAEGLDLIGKDIPQFFSTELHFNKFFFHLSRQEIESAKLSLREGLKGLSSCGTQPGYNYEKYFAFVDILIGNKMENEAIQLLEFILSYYRSNQVVTPEYQEFNTLLSKLYEKNSHQDGIAKCQERKQFFQSKSSKK